MSFWGYYFSPKCIVDSCFYTSILPFNKPSTKSVKRIGPHNKDLYSIIFGSLLGDAYAEKRGKGVRIHFYQENSHGAYAIWLNDLLVTLGYNKSECLEESTRLIKGGKVRKIFRFKTYTYSSFIHLHDIFYFNGIKNVPSNIYLETYLTPLALAIWIQDDGCKAGKGLKLATNSFTKSDVSRLAAFLALKFNLKTTTPLAGNPCKDQYSIYISSYSMKTLALTVKPFIVPSMKYKFGPYFV